MLVQEHGRDGLKMPPQPGSIVDVSGEDSGCVWGVKLRRLAHDGLVMMRQM